jgi:hypothetical protein
MARRIKVELTEAQALALAGLAECAANSYDDALAVLDSPGRVRAGYAALEALNHAIHGRRS